MIPISRTSKLRLRQVAWRAPGHTQLVATGLKLEPTPKPPAAKGISLSVTQHCQHAHGPFSCHGEEWGIRSHPSCPLRPQESSRGDIAAPQVAHLENGWSKSFAGLSGLLGRRTDRTDIQRAAGAEPGPGRAPVSGWNPRSPRVTKATLREQLRSYYGPGRGSNVPPCVESLMARGMPSL